MLTIYYAYNALSPIPVRSENPAFTQKPSLGFSETVRAFANYRKPCGTSGNNAFDEKSKPIRKGANR
jgi:hypothetical protein